MGAVTAAQDGRSVRFDGRIAAVIVTYFPPADRVRTLLDATLPQVDCAVVVDNTPQPVPALDALQSDRCDVIRNGSNVGLAAAQNQGIRAARTRGCDHVLLLDDDSLPDVRMVAALARALAALRAQGIAVAAVGPRWHDRHTGRDAPFVRLGFGRMRSIGCAAGSDACVECDTLVSSGCLIPLASLDAIGPMDEALFIDQVDVEWGIRAQARGYRLFGACDAVLYHGIGVRSVRPWFARARSVPVHAPVRDYYLVRNTVAVFFTRRAPWRWRLLQAVRLPALILVMLTQMPPRRERARYIGRALVDALRGRLGPLATGHGA